VARAAEPDLLDRVVAIAPAPLLPGENDTDYANLAKCIVTAAKPKDIIEEVLTRDVIDLSWEILRLRRLKIGMLKASKSDGVREILDNLGHGEGRTYGYTQKLSRSWAAGDKSACREVERALNAAELGNEEVTAKTLESKLDSFERLDACWQAPRRVGTTPSAKLTATAPRSAAPFVSQSRKLRTQISGMSRQGKRQEAPDRDQRLQTSHESPQCEIEHGAQDCGGKGAFGAKCVSTRLEYSSSLGPLARAGDRGDGAQDLRL
jgi:hypothetical protein